MRKKIKRRLGARVSRHNSSRNKRDGAQALRDCAELGISTTALHRLMDEAPARNFKPCLTLGDVQRLRQASDKVLADVRAHVEKARRQWQEERCAELLLHTMPVTKKEQRVFNRVKKLVFSDTYLGKGYKPAPKKISPAAPPALAPDDEVASGPRERRQWEPHEDAYLREKWGRVPTRLIAEALNVSYFACYKRAQKLGLMFTKSSLCG